MSAQVPSSSPTPPSPSATDAIRSLQDKDSIYKAFDSYPWSKDDTFKSGLDAILGTPSSTPNPADVATHARIFYYAQRIGVKIDFGQYQSWLSQHPDHQPPQLLPDHFLPQQQQQQTISPSNSASSEQAPLSWQQAAPKADLYIDKSNLTSNPPPASSNSGASATAGAGAADGGEPTYPMGFAEMIKLLQEGKQVPGIRQIPDTVIRDPSVKPVGTRTVPRKPWEKDSGHASSPIPHFGELDAEFPAIDQDSSRAVDISQ